MAEYPARVLPRPGERPEFYRTCEQAMTTADPQQLKKLVSHPEREVRRVLAQRTDLPDHLNRSLSADPDWQVRHHLVLWNKCLPTDVFGLLADDPAWIVRKAVAANKHCPPGIVERLSADPSPWVRAATVRNRNATVGVLRRLAADRSRPVRGAFRQKQHVDRFLRRLHKREAHSRPPE